MSTEKTIKIQKNKILTYSINKEGFKTIYGSVLVNENQNINVEMKNLNSQDEPFQLGDRLFGISSFVDYFTPSGTYDVDSLKYIFAKQTTGSGLTNIQVVKDTWLSKVETELGIETPKGTSNNFIFTYNGATWDITGALTLAGQSLENFGISFEGTATSGDVITVVETQYNKFAFFVLDSNYRSNQKWVNNALTEHIYPNRYNYNQWSNCKESATYCYNFLIDNYNLSSYPLMNYCKNLGNFILSNGVKINGIVPNTIELKAIWTNRVLLDSYDPTITTTGQTYNLTNWSFNEGQMTGRTVWTCIEANSYNNLFNSLRTNGEFSQVNSGGELAVDNVGCVPIFEVPVM